jgi:hypothetical protein
MVVRYIISQYRLHGGRILNPPIRLHGGGIQDSPKHRHIHHHNYQQQYEYPITNLLKFYRRTSSYIVSPSRLTLFSLH